MVQLTDADGVPAVIGVPVLPQAQSFLGSLEQMPHTSLSGPSISPPSVLGNAPHDTPLSPAASGQVFSSVAFPYSTPLSPSTHNLSPSTHSFETHCRGFADSSASDSVFSPEMSTAQALTVSGFGPLDMMPSTNLDLCSTSVFESQRMCGGGFRDGSRSFEVIAVADNLEHSSGMDIHKVNNRTVHFSEQVDCYLNDNQQQAGTDALDNKQQRESCNLQRDVHVDSMDSLIESKGYSSDSSSDIYMNSDYTDTITSTNSSTFLLQASTAADNSTESEDHTVSSSAENSALLVSNCFRNEAYGSDAAKELITWSSEQLCQDGQASEMEEDVSNHWVVPLPEQEDSGMLADKEDEEEEHEAEEQVPLQVDSALENLVNHLAEQHPHEMVDISVQVLDGPVYEALTVPLQEDGEGSWMQSTDSLHHYKLLKQGRSTLTTSLRVHALTNTMHNLHERSSFLNLTATSVTSLGKACQKALTYVRADMEFGSMMSLRDGKHFSQLPGKGQSPSDLEALSLDKKGQATVASGCHTRNVVYMALLTTILLIAVNTTRNLQSSLNQEGGVGIVCLAALCTSYMLGSLLSPVMVQGLGVKVCITGGLLLQLLYVAANLHPVLWLMLPAALGGGASLAVIWNAMSTYIVLLARGESDSKQKSYERVSDKFFGIFCLIFQSNLIFGNLIASLVLTFADGSASNALVVPLLANDSMLNSTWTNLSAPFLNNTATADLSVMPEIMTEAIEITMGSNSSNATSTPLAFNASTDSHYHLCGSAYCYHFVIEQESSAVPQRTVYLLFGILMFLVVVAMLMALFLLEPLSPHLFSSPSSSKPWQTVRRQLVSLAKFSRNGKFLLLLPMMLYCSMQFSFVCSEVMMAFVTCPVGVWLVGYTMIGYGVCCSLSSYLTQALVKVTGRAFFIAIASLLNIGLLVFMRLWQPHPDSIFPLFIITCIFGLTDGVWNVNINGLCGSVFPNHYEEAFTGLRVAQGLGGAFTMAVAPFFCMSVKIYLMITSAVVVLIGYAGAECLIRREAKQRKQLLYEKEIV